MDCINHVTMVGRLGRDAETKYTRENIPVTHFAIGIGYNRRALDTGEYDEKLEFFHCVLWRNPGLGKLLKKGCVVAISGHLENSNRKDRDGPFRYAIDIVVDQCVLVGDPATWSPMDKIGMKGKPEPRLVKGLTPEVTDEELPF